MVESTREYLDRLQTVVKSRNKPTDRKFSGREISYKLPWTGATWWNNYGDKLAEGEFQHTVSVDNPYLWHLKRSNRLSRTLDVGGPFTTTKLNLRVESKSYFDLRRGSVAAPSYTYVGDLCPHVDVWNLMNAIYLGKVPNNTIWNNADAMDKNELQLIGERIMLSVVPTSTPFNAITALGEPIIDQRFFGLPGHALINGDPGGEYLNTVFGLLPTIQDIQHFNTVVNASGDILRQYFKDSDKLIRRRTKPIEIPEEVTEVKNVAFAPITASGPGLTAFLWGGTSPGCTVTTRINREIWYAGAFMYHVPKDLSSWNKNIYEWQRLYHVVPHLSDIWELLPFSWLVDYFSNSGNSLRHLFLQSSEGAAQVYGYIMCQSKVEKTYVWNGSLRENDTLVPYTITAVVTKTIKQRIRCSPFGVKFTGVDLTPRQLAILAALGISK